MGKTRVVGVGKDYQRRLASTLLKPLVEEQTKLLVDYAKSKIIEIGNYIQTAPTVNQMDRTGHLLNSLCWGVSFQGKLVDGGFYRNAVTHKRRQSGWESDGKTKRYTDKSELHEWNPDISEPVDGRQLAKEYLKSYGNNGSRGWRVFFAILAPYWGYWEKGFRFKLNPRSGGGGYGFMQFAVMTYFYDQVRRDLKPARVRFRSSVRKYNAQKLTERAMR